MVGAWKQAPSMDDISNGGFMFIVVVMNYWGRGKTISEAKAKVKETRGSVIKKSEKKKVWYFDPDKFYTDEEETEKLGKSLPYVDGMGSMCWCPKGEDKHPHPVDVTYE